MSLPVSSINLSPSRFYSPLSTIEDATLSDLAAPLPLKSPQDLWLEALQDRGLIGKDLRIQNEKLPSQLPPLSELQRTQVSDLLSQSYPLGPSTLELTPFLIWVSDCLKGEHTLAFSTSPLSQYGYAKQCASALDTPAPFIIEDAFPGPFLALSYHLESQLQFEGIRQPLLSYLAHRGKVTNFETRNDEAKKLPTSWLEKDGELLLVFGEEPNSASVRFTLKPRPKKDAIFLNDLIIWMNKGTMESPPLLHWEGWSWQQVVNRLGGCLPIDDQIEPLTQILSLFQTFSPTKNHEGDTHLREVGGRKWISAKGRPSLFFFPLKGLNHLERFSSDEEFLAWKDQLLKALPEELDEAQFPFCADEILPLLEGNESQKWVGTLLLVLLFEKKKQGEVLNCLLEGGADLQLDSSYQPILNRFKRAIVNSPYGGLEEELTTFLHQRGPPFIARFAGSDNVVLAEFAFDRWKSGIQDQPLPFSEVSKVCKFYLPKNLPHAWRVFSEGQKHNSKATQEECTLFSELVKATQKATSQAQSQAIPHMVASAKALLERYPKPTRKKIKGATPLHLEYWIPALSLMLDSNYLFEVEVLFKQGREKGLTAQNMKGAIDLWNGLCKKALELGSSLLSYSLWVQGEPEWKKGEDEGYLRVQLAEALFDEGIEEIEPLLEGFQPQNGHVLGYSQLLERQFYGKMRSGNLDEAERVLLRQMEHETLPDVVREEGKELVHERIKNGDWDPLFNILTNSRFVTVFENEKETLCHLIITALQQGPTHRLSPDLLRISLNLSLPITKPLVSILLKTMRNHHPLPEALKVTLCQRVSEIITILEGTEISEGARLLTTHGIRSPLSLEALDRCLKNTTVHILIFLFSGKQEALKHLKSTSAVELIHSFQTLSPDDYRSWMSRLLEKFSDEELVLMAAAKSLSTWPVHIRKEILLKHLNPHFALLLVQTLKETKNEEDKWKLIKVFLLQDGFSYGIQDPIFWREIHSALQKHPSNLTWVVLEKSPLPDQPLFEACLTGISSSPPSEKSLRALIDLRENLMVTQNKWPAPLIQACLLSEVIDLFQMGCRALSKNPDVEMLLLASQQGRNFNPSEGAITAVLSLASLPLPITLTSGEALKLASEWGQFPSLFLLKKSLELLKEHGKISNKLDKTSGNSRDEALNSTIGQLVQLEIEEVDVILYLTTAIALDPNGEIISSKTWSLVLKRAINFDKKEQIQILHQFAHLYSKIVSSLTDEQELEVMQNYFPLLACLATDTKSTLLFNDNLLVILKHLTNRYIPDAVPKELNDHELTEDSQFLEEEELVAIQFKCQSRPLKLSKKENEIRQAYEKRFVHYLAYSMIALLKNLKKPDDPLANFFTTFAYNNILSISPFLIAHPDIILDAIEAYLFCVSPTNTGEFGTISENTKTIIKSLPLDRSHNTFARINQFSLYLDLAFMPLYQATDPLSKKRVSYQAIEETSQLFKKLSLKRGGYLFRALQIFKQIQGDLFDLHPVWYERCYTPVFEAVLANPFEVILGDTLCYWFLVNMTLYKGDHKGTIVGTNGPPDCRQLTLNFFTTMFQCVSEKSREYENLTIYARGKPYSTLDYLFTFLCRAKEQGVFDHDTAAYQDVKNEITQIHKLLPPMG